MHWLAKEEIAHTTKFESLISLAINIGAKELKALSKGANAKYTSERTMHEIIEVLSATVEEEILQDIRASPLISILCDESTDIAIVKQLVVYVRYIKNGKTVTRFLKIQDLFDGTAVTIETALLEILSKLQIPLEKVAAFGSDGAAVMVGRRNGVATKLKDRIPHLVAIHCVAHRLALATAHASDSVACIKKYSITLQTIYYFFQNSSVRMAHLQEIQQILGDPSLKFKEPKHVRWLSHGKAVTAIRRCLPSLITTLEQEAVNNPTAAGLVKAVMKYEFVACTFLLSDILPSLNWLSLIFQRKDIYFSVIQPRVHSTISFLESLKSNDGPVMKQLPKIFEEELITFNFNATSEKSDNFKRLVAVPYIGSICENLSDRFPHLDILDAFQIFSPEVLPTDSEALLDHGHAQLQTLLGNYSPSLVDAQRIEEEWAHFLPDMTMHFKEKTIDSVLASLTSNSVYRDSFTELAKLAAAALVIPMSTADCERGFSAMKRIKTDLRNSLKTETLDYLMRISIEGKDREDFNFDRSADMWAAKRNRRLHV